MASCACYGQLRLEHQTTATCHTITLQQKAWSCITCHSFTGPCTRTKTCIQLLTLHSWHDMTKHCSPYSALHHRTSHSRQRAASHSKSVLSQRKAPVTQGASGQKRKASHATGLRDLVGAPGPGPFPSAGHGPGPQSTRCSQSCDDKAVRLQEPLVTTGAASHMVRCPDLHSKLVLEHMMFWHNIT